VILLVVALLVLPGCEERDESGIRGYMNLSAEEMRPESFEPYLAEHPEDNARRTAALIWYDRREPDPEKLRKHTFEMIRYHPTNYHICWENVTEFYKDQDYRHEVQRALEDQLEAGHTQHEVYWILAKICQRGAMPPVGDDPDAREWFFRYFGVPEDTVLVEEVDEALAEKAVDYYRSAIRGGGRDPMGGLYVEGLSKLLIKLDRPEEAAKVCEEALPHADEISKPGLLITYGHLLVQLDEIERAKDALSQVRSIDTEGFEGGPAHATTEAETSLGLIALGEGDTATAREYLLSSCDVQQCCHNITRGMPLSLAKDLLEAGQADAVIEYCETVLREFTPGDEIVERLLDKAKEGKQTPPSAGEKAGDEDG
jgi:tetratricopeptide (TPR) repeat protein